jgi:light-regulated signal transduction histidine kinase (bacteriophytochrome)
MALAFTAAALALTIAGDLFAGRKMFQLAVVAVVLSAWYGGLGPGLMSAVVSAVGISYVVLPPKMSLRVETWEDVLQLFVFMVVAVLMSSLSEARYRAEAGLRARTAQLEAANRELEAFSYSVSHDLRSPLRAIDGYSKIVLEEHGSTIPVPARQHLEFVRRSAQHLDRLVNDLLEFSRLGRRPLRREPILMDELTREAWADLKPETEGRTVEFSVGPMPPCHGDRLLLKQALFNLLHNALKFSRPRSVARIEVGAQASSSSPVYFVRDNGVGFDMAYADKLFGVFQRLHRDDEYEGTGVGLANVQRIITRHGGRVWAEAAPGRGATLFFTIGKKDMTDGLH